MEIIYAITLMKDTQEKDLGRIFQKLKFDQHISNAVKIKF